jgi:hypothetical protein
VVRHLITQQHSNTATSLWRTFRCAATLCITLSASGSLYADLYSGLYVNENDPKTSQDELLPQPNMAVMASFEDNHQAISKRVVRFANWLDNFFGDSRIDDESQDSRLRLNLLEINEKGAEPRFEARVQGKLSLPNTQKRLKILFESDPSDSASPDGTIIEAVENQQQSLGLRYIQFTSDWLRAHTDVGVRFRNGLDPFTRFRLRGLFNLKPLQLRLTETLFWRASKGAGLSSRLDIERPFGNKHFFRSSSQAIWLDDIQTFELSQDFFLFHSINKHRGIIYQLGRASVSERSTQTSGYIASLRLRQQIHKDWLFFEINPKILYPEDEKFQARPSLTFKLEVIFGGI